MSNQKVIKPNINNCWCGEKAIPYEDYNFRNLYRIECKNGHVMTKFCNYHRAVCRWNNRVAEKLAKEKCNMPRATMLKKIEDAKNE